MAFSNDLNWRARAKDSQNSTYLGGRPERIPTEHWYFELVVTPGQASRRDVVDPGRSLEDAGSGAGYLI